MNVLELLDAHGIKYHRDGKDIRQGFVGLACPFCHHSGYYLGINVAKGYAACWSCGPHSLADIIAACAGLPLPQAIAAAKGVTRLHAPERPPGVLKVPAGVGPLLPAHKRYLRGRGFDPDTLTAIWGLGGIGIAPRLGWSIYIPITRHGAVVSWTTRTIGDGPRRYQGAGPTEEAWPAKSWLYGLDLCRHAVIVVEGPADAWRIGPGAGAVMGLSYSAAQVAAIAAYPIRAICFDNEPAAQARAGRLADDLAPFRGETYRVCLDAKDPGGAQVDEIAELRARFLE